MTVIVLERVPSTLRGELTRWMLEPKTGVFVGTLSALVRDKVWEFVCGKVGEGGAVMIHRADSEQGFAIRTWGKSKRTVIDFDGLWLVTH